MNWKRENCPCTSECPDRKGGCSIACERYKLWRADYDQRKAARDKAIELHQHDVEYNNAVSARFKRYNGIK